VNWIDDGLPGAGDLLAFNNGDRPGTGDDYSTVEEIVPPLQEDGTYYLAPGSAFGPVTSTWTFGGPGGFFGGPTHCGAFRLPNGNTLICATVDGYVFEVTEAGVTVWDYDDPNRIARAQRYWDDATAVTPGQETFGLPSFRLETNYPNPFNSATTITYELDRQSKVFLRIYDVSGRLVRVLLGDEVVPAGRHEVVWNGRDRSGRAVTAGVYFYRLETGSFSETRRMTLIK
jgi:hypothetical protein